MNLIKRPKRTLVFSDFYFQISAQTHFCCSFCELHELHFHNHITSEVIHPRPGPERWISGCAIGQGQRHEPRANEEAVSQGSDGDGELMRGLRSSWTTWRRWWSSRSQVSQWWDVSWLHRSSPVVPVMREEREQKEKKLFGERNKCEINKREAGWDN